MPCVEFPDLDAGISWNKHVHAHPVRVLLGPGDAFTFADGEWSPVPQFPISAFQRAVEEYGQELRVSREELHQLMRGGKVTVVECGAISAEVANSDRKCKFQIYGATFKEVRSRRSIYAFQTLIPPQQHLTVITLAVQTAADGATEAHQAVVLAVVAIKHADTEHDALLIGYLQRAYFTSFSIILYLIASFFII